MVDSPASHVGLSEGIQHLQLEGSKSQSITWGRLSDRKLFHRMGPDMNTSNAKAWFLGTHLWEVNDCEAQLSDRLILITFWWLEVDMINTNAVLSWLKSLRK